MAVPKKVLLEENQVLAEWSDGHRSVFTNKNLREACPCALCAGESTPITKTRTIPLSPVVLEGIRATKFSMIGLYAVSFVWTDGHRTGIYPYDYLLELCECDSCTEKRKTQD